MLRIKLVCHCFFVLFFLFMSPLHVFAYTVLWDISDDTYDVYIPSTSGGRYQDLAVDLQGNGFAIQTVSGFSTGNLAAADVAVISSPTAASSYDVGLLQSFVAGGGGLLVMADYLNYTNYADVAGAFNISFSNPYYKGYTGDLVTAHPVCDGITSVEMYWGAGVDISAGSAEAIVSVADGADTILLAASAVYGSGRVVVLSDSSLWASYESGGNTYDYYGTPDNAQFAENVFDHLVDTTYIPEPATMLLVAAGAAMLRRKKR